MRRPNDVRIPSPDGIGTFSRPLPALAQPGWVLSHQKISDTQGGFTGRLDNVDWFGKSVASLGDLDGDGAIDTLDIEGFLSLLFP